MQETPGWGNSLTPNQRGSNTPSHVPTGPAFKLNDLNVYCSTEWLAYSKKRYRDVFEAMHVDYLYLQVHFFNMRFGYQAWEAKIDFKCYEEGERGRLGKLICEFSVTRTIEPTNHEVYVREGWGNATKGKFWKKGSYIWQVFINDTILGSKNFYIEDKGLTDQQGRPYFELETVRFFESDSAAKDEGRVYVMNFDSKTVRYVWAELSLRILQKEAFKAEFVSIITAKNGELKAMYRSFYTLQPSSSPKPSRIWFGWGSNNGGTWYPGEYFYKILFHEQLIAEIPFTIT